MPHHHSGPGAGYLRPVSPTERLYLAAGQARGTMALRILVHGHGVLAPSRLKAAVAQAAQSCPGSRLVRRGNLWSAEGPPPRIRYAEPVPHFDVAEPAIADRLSGASSRTDPPGCEVLVVPGAQDEATTLVFSASHALMDGHGALTWVREVFGGLRGEPARAALAPLTDEGLLSELGATGPRPRMAPNLPSPLGPCAAGPEQTLWLRRTLPGHHHALTARLAQALSDVVGTRTRVMIPVDLRRHLPAAAATGNLTLPLFLDLAPRADWTSAQAQLLTALADGRELSAGFEKVLARLPLPGSALLLRAAQAMAVRADRHLASAVISDLGRVDPGDFSGGGFTAATVYALPVHAPLVPLSVVVAQTPTTTEVTMGSRGGPGLAARAGHLLDSVLERVSTTTATPRPATPRRTASVPTAPVDATMTTVVVDATMTTVVDQFRAQVARTPQAVALDGPEGPVSYAELDAASDRVARALALRGIGREDLVGLIVDRSPTGVGALWGVLKSGAAYLPLDPAHPGPRIEQVLRESRARLCLTRAHLAARLVADVPCPLVTAEELSGVPADTWGTTTPPAPSPADLAYVIHTSGSTGRPKGVQIEHRSLMGFVQWMTGVCEVGDTTRFGFVSSYTFDISCFPLFLTLLAGGTAVLAPDAPSRASLRRLVVDHRADTLALTPSHLALLPEHPLRTLLLGGEPLTWSAVRAARSAFGPHCRIVNGYGPTEATVACLAQVVDGGTIETTATVPVGTPGPHAHVELVAEDGSLLGSAGRDAGRTGEIQVRGLQVARGYLNVDTEGGRPFATGADGVRSYRTGDLGRRLPDGAIEFLGRVDGQLKISGHRIEPAEVTAALEAHPQVRRAVVCARRRTDDSPAALCAYVVPEDASLAEGMPALLRAELAGQLPTAMVPAHVIAVTAIPWTVSGKADFDALPDPFARTADASQGAGLRDRVARHWGAVLGLDAAELPADADFHALGGDSLGLIEMLAAVAADLLAPTQRERFMSRLEDLVRDVTLDQVCAQIKSAQEEAPV
ncbi:non-ribosomal peptide synthetase [Streptomyces sp. NPDC006879]|uniref:non-ribosomal peptide synthetase n=1 Tax=Streptomyces sp. NPDC006879 TaxID=3364767 RepID=UPI00368D03A5